MANKAYYLEQQYKSIDDGVTWTPVPDTYRVGRLAEDHSNCRAEVYSKWVVDDVMYDCDGTNKYSIEVKYVSSNAVDWYKAEPLEYRRKEIIEFNSPACGASDYNFQGFRDDVEDNVIPYSKDTAFAAPMYIKSEKDGNPIGWYIYKTEGEDLDVYRVLTKSTLYAGFKTKNTGHTRFGKITLKQVDEESYLDIYVMQLGELSGNEVSGLLSDGSTVHIPVTDGIVPREVFGTKSVKIAGVGENITEIGSRAFYYRSGLEYVQMYGNITKIGSMGFYRCWSLKKIILNKNLQEIGNNAFNYCEDLKSVKIPDSVTTMGTSVFRACKSLEQVNIGTGITAIPNSTFRECSSLKSIVIPANITSIGDTAFSDCASLQEVTINDNTNIGSQTFSGCEKLEKVIGDLGNLDYRAFSSCERLTSIKLGTGCSFIGSSALGWCYLLTKVIFKQSEVTISKDAFYSDNLLSSIVCQNGCEGFVVPEDPFTRIGTKGTLLLPVGTKADKLMQYLKNYSWNYTYSI